MKKFLNKVITGILATALFLSAVPTVIPAADTPDMKVATVSWDLKADKQISFPSYWLGIGYKNYTALVKNMKITDAEKKGYKKLTFSLVIDYPEIKKGEVHKFCTAASDHDGNTGATWYCTLTDYKTGQCLEVENDKNVTVTSTGIKHSNKKTLKDSDGCKFSYYANAEVKKMTVVYPEDYKNLCLIVGGTTKSYLANPSVDDDFWSGTGKFSKTSFYNKKNKQLAHAMRIK